MQLKVPSVQVQPVPLIAVAVKPAGSVSATVSCSASSARAGVSDRDRVSRTGLTLDEVARVRFADGEIGNWSHCGRIACAIVGSVDFTAARNRAVLVTDAGAFAATFTVTVIGHNWRPRQVRRCGYSSVFRAYKSSRFRQSLSR